MRDPGTYEKLICPSEADGPTEQEPHLRRSKPGFENTPCLLSCNADKHLLFQKLRKYYPREVIPVRSLKPGLKSRPAEVI